MHLNKITVPSPLTNSAKVFDDLISVVFRHLLAFLAILTCVTCLGLAYLLTTPSSYTSKGMLLIDTRKLQVLLQNQQVVGDAMVDAGTVQTQIEILKSEKIGLEVIRNLKLAQDPEFITAGSSPIGVTIDFVRHFLSFGRQETDYDRERRVLATFTKHSAIDRVGLTYVMEISFTSTNAKKASLIANAIAEAYINDQLQAKYESTRNASVWLQGRLRELAEQATDAEREVVDFKEKHGIVDIIDAQGHRLNDQQLVEANSQLGAAHAATTQAKARLDRIREILKDPVNTSNVADAQTNEVIINLRRRLLDLSSQESILSAKYGKDHLAVVDLRNQMNGIRRNIDDEVQKIAQSYKSDYDIAVAHETALATTVASAVSATQSTDQAQVQLAELENNASTYKSLYSTFMQRYLEAIQQQSFPITESRIISPPPIPTEPSGPKTLIVFPVTLASGLLLAFATALALERTDRVFRSTSQVESMLKVSCLGLLPKVKLTSGNHNRKAKPRSDGGRRELARAGSIYSYAVDVPLSMFTETLRAVKVSADLANPSARKKVIGITSTLPKEGKSTASANFAQMIAHSGSKCLLIDADLRNPSLSRALAPKARAGLVGLVAGSVVLDDAVWTDGRTGLHFLPTGEVAHIAHTGELLGSEAMKRLFLSLRDKYDYIVVDLAPLAPVIDTRVTGFVDGYVYMVEWGRTSVDLVEQTLSSAPEIRDRLVGVLLSKVEMRKLGRYESNTLYLYNKYYTSQGYLSDARLA